MVAIIGSSLSAYLASKLLKKGYTVFVFEKGNYENKIDKNVVFESLKIKGIKTTTLNESFGGTSELWTGGLVKELELSNIKEDLEIKLKILKQ